MAGVELDDAAGPAGELALQPRRGAPVLSAADVRRGHLLPCGRLDRLPGHLHALPGEVVRRPRGQLRESAEQQLWPNFRRTATTDWLGPLEDGLRSIGRPDLATLVLAVIRGLLMDLDATGDTTRTDRAFRDFLGAVEHLSSGPTRRL